MIRSRFILAGGVLGAIIAGGLVFDYARDPVLISVSEYFGEAEEREKTPEERHAEAKERSENRRGVYMTYDVAADGGRAATRLREDILKLIDETELNAVVIDVKETKGTMISDGLAETVQTFRKKGIWTIARMTMMRDNSQTAPHPEFYIRRANGAFWRDNHGHMWLDPSHPGVLEYNLREVKRAIDIGFDEIQYDYVRFPSDGNMKDIVYPSYRPPLQKYEAIRDFLASMEQELRVYKPEIILSADLFGYVAMQAEDLTIGQRLVDIGDSVDYISLMVYPSHYYAGFYTPADPVRGLASIFIPYKDPDPKKVVSSNPYEIIYRSMLIADDVLSGRATTTKDGSFMTATSTPNASAHIRAKMRPWLQDFDLGVDKARGIYYDAAKVRGEIKAADDAGTSGWLLWNPSNVYTAEALQRVSVGAE